MVKKVSLPTMRSVYDPWSAPNSRSARFQLTLRTAIYWVLILICVGGSFGVTVFLLSGCAELAGIDDVSYDQTAPSQLAQEAGQDSALLGALEVDAGEPDSAADTAQDAAVGPDVVSGQDGGKDSSTGQDGSQDGQSAEAGDGVDAWSMEASADGCVWTSHDNGFGHGWTDCEPLGTYNQAQAMSACDANPNSSEYGCFLVAPGTSYYDAGYGCPDSSLILQELPNQAGTAINYYGWVYSGFGTGNALVRPSTLSGFDCSMEGGVAWR